MDVNLGAVISAIVLVIVLLALFEFRIRQPDVLVLSESKSRIGIRGGLVYPRHFSLPLARTIYPIQLNIEVTAAGNLGVRVRLVGSVAPSIEHIQSLIRVGGWNTDAVAHAAEEAQIYLQGLIQEYSERSEIHTLSSTNILNHLNEHAGELKERFGVELISLAVQSLEPVDEEIAEALRQQEQARIIEQTEKLNHQARVAAAKAKHRADEEIAEMEHSLELRRIELRKTRLEQEAALDHQRLEEELAQNRMRLSLEQEELAMLKGNPELLILTPQAARLAEASQSLKNARTVISLNPQDLVGSEILEMFQNLLQKALEPKQDGGPDVRGQT